MPERGGVPVVVLLGVREAAAPGAGAVVRRPVRAEIPFGFIMWALMLGFCMGFCFGRFA